MISSTASLRAASGAALLSLLAAGCSKSPTVATASVTPTPAAVAPVPASTMPSPTRLPAPRPASAAVVGTTNPPIAVESHTEQAMAAWAAIKDCTFDQKAAFLAGANNLVSMLDGQVAELKAKRASFASTVDTKNWDFAMNDLLECQAYLRSTVLEAGQATPDIWQQEKDKLDQAWQKAQAAFDTVKTTVTAS